MRYGRYRRRRYSSPSSRQTVIARVNQAYFGLDDLIRPMFFKLSPNQLARLLVRYGAEFGESARSHAEKSYPAWKNGTQKMAGTTVERLILLLPHVLEAGDKYELVKHLRERTRSRMRASFTLKFMNQIIVIREEIKQYIARGREFTLPDTMAQTLTWLANNDAKAAQALLVAVADREAKDSLRQLDSDLLRLATVIQNTPANASVTFTVDLPQVGATIYASGGLAMSDPNPTNQPQTTGGGLPSVKNAGDLLTQSFQSLGAEDKNRLALKANDEALRLRVRDLESQLDGRNADKDIERLLETTNRVQQQNVDFDVRQNMKTESGHMNVHVSKKSPSSNPIIWIIAGVIGVIVLALVLKR